MGRFILSKVHQAWGLKALHEGDFLNPTLGQGSQAPGICILASGRRLRSLLWPHAYPRGLRSGQPRDTVRFHHSRRLPWTSVTFSPFIPASLTISPEHHDFDILKLSGHLPERGKKGLKLVSVGHADCGPRGPPCPSPACAHLRTGLAMLWTLGHGHKTWNTPCTSARCWARLSQSPYLALGSVEPAAGF